MVVLDFDQWRILLQGPGVIIDGGRLADKGAAKEQACRIAGQYVSREEDAALPVPAAVEWTPLAPRALLFWQAQGQTTAGAAEA